MVELLISAILVCLILIICGIYLIVSKKNKNLGVILLIIGFALPLIGLSICGIILINLDLGSMN